MHVFSSATLFERLKVAVQNSLFFSLTMVHLYHRRKANNITENNKVEGLLSSMPVLPIKSPEQPKT